MILRGATGFMHKMKRRLGAQVYSCVEEEDDDIPKTSSRASTKP